MKKIIVFCVALWSIFIPTTATAWPERPVTIVVPYAVGGGTDILIRRLQTPLSKLWRQPVIIDNRPGAQGLIGMRYAIKENNDHVILFGNGDLLVNATIMHPQEFSQREITPVTILYQTPLALASNPNNQYRDPALLIQAIKNNKLVKIGTPGLDSISHYVVEKFINDIGYTQKPIVVPYNKGGAPMVTDTIAQHVDLGASSVGGTLQTHLVSGTLSPVVVFARKRLLDFPNTPTAIELGYNIVAHLDFGAMFVTKAVDDKIKNKIYQDLRNLITKETIFFTDKEKSYYEIMLSDPQTSERHILQGIKDWKPFIQP